ncbi:Protein of unknown function [Lactobacillus delbrueckii subsp. lactis]|nr:Protein of unknown function [Lactobacillus delbrueckii subsp. lactis]
MIVYGLNLIE